MRMGGAHRELVVMPWWAHDRTFVSSPLSAGSVRVVDPAARVVAAPSHVGADSLACGLRTDPQKQLNTAQCALHQTHCEAHSGRSCHGSGPGIAFVSHAVLNLGPLGPHTHHPARPVSATHTPVHCPPNFVFYNDTLDPLLFDAAPPLLPSTLPVRGPPFQAPSPSSA